LNKKKSHINPKLNKNVRKRVQETLSVDALIAGVQSRDRQILAQAITLVESTHAEDRKTAEALLTGLAAHKNKNCGRIVITGSPGAGKSTLINALGNEIVKSGKSLAILATDPSSAISQGSIMGDKTRMSDIGHVDSVFIRPTPSGNYLGGISKSTLETIQICEAAQFDYIILETVGVGQSEYESYKLSDIFLLLLNPGAGDEIQGIKRGIMEMADIVCINKYDSGTKALAEATEKKYKNAIKLLQNNREEWETKVFKVSSIEHVGIPKLWNCIADYIDARIASGLLEQQRVKNNLSILQEKAENYLLSKHLENKAIQNIIENSRANIANKETSLLNALQAMYVELDKIFKDS